jgi:hypothetical protein
MAGEPRTAAGGLFLAWLDALPTEMDQLRLTDEQLAQKAQKADRIEAAMQQHIAQNAAEAD